MNHTTTAVARVGVASALAASVVALGAAPASAAPAAPQAGAVGSVTGTWTAPGGRTGPINATVGTPTATVGANGRVVLGADVTMTAAGTGAPTVTRRVAVPTSATSTAAPGTTTTLAAAADIPVPAGCTVLHLVLGPLDLNLLGLAIVLQQVTLDIVAVPGPGNLLGNLLCGIVNLIPAPPVPA
ncbi:hypothetical protein GCM10027047_27760 [Rhodococcus aerolatus]